MSTDRGREDVRVLVWIYIYISLCSLLGWCSPGWRKMRRFALKPLATAIPRPNLVARTSHHEINCSPAQGDHMSARGRLRSRKVILSQGGRHQVRLGRIRHRSGHWEKPGTAKIYGTVYERSRRLQEVRFEIVQRRLRACCTIPNESS